MTKESLDVLYWVAGIIIGSGLIEISPLKLNPWTWLLSPLRKALVGHLSDRVTLIETKVDKVQTEFVEFKEISEQKEADATRRRILHFDDDILQKRKHTKEHFDQILADIDEYEDYCADHPKYTNNKAMLAIKNIKEVYESCLTHNGFLSLDDDIMDVRKKKYKKEIEELS